MDIIFGKHNNNEQEIDLQVEASRIPNSKGQEGDKEGQEEDKGRVKDWARTRWVPIGVNTITIPLGVVGGS